jgi:hypothetical protein
MNTADIKSYAPQARRDFIAAVSDRAAMYGITVDGIEPVTVQGDVAIIAGRAYPKSVAPKRARLEERVQRDGFQQAMEAIAYTWFNRFAALRYMELHGYLDHGYRVLSHPDGSGRPEILDHAVEIDLPGLDRDKVVELKLDGTKDEDLYRLLLTAQCNALHQAMPFLFEKIGDETELLLPANLLHSDSLIRKLVEEIDEELWAEIEIIGWLYQFYISEKKDQVIGKVVKSEDIPAATQLFTPNWIVKYMVQNSLGAQWLATYPQSPLKGQMAYYIEPAEQTDEVKAQLAAITPDTLNPEELTLIDPACGSGHILVEAYELFKAIYLERGYRLQDVPKLILEKNLFGLDIDERAAQLTGFALMMKGRADDRRLFERTVTLNVMALVDSTGFDAEGLAKGVKLSDYSLKPEDLTELKRLFEHATTFGSLIQVPEELAKKLPALNQLSETTSRDLFVSDALKRMRPLVQQAKLLAAQYETVAANPPYMGVKLMSRELKAYVKAAYPDSSENLCGCFIERGLDLSASAGGLALVGLQNWMFQSSFAELRQLLLSAACLKTLVQIGFNSFPTLNSKVALAAAFCANKRPLDSYVGSYFNCNDAPHAGDKRLVFEDKLKRGERFLRSPDSFRAIPGSPISYWASADVRRAFDQGTPIASVAAARQGLSTSDNERFVRAWHEVDIRGIHLSGAGERPPIDSGLRWVPFNKGGRARRWYGNNEFVVDWTNDGAVIKSLPGSAVRNEAYYFQPAITWSDITITTAFRLQDAGFIFANSAHSAFCDDPDQRLWLLGLLNSRIVQVFVGALSQSLHFDVGYYNVLPLPADAIDKAVVAAVIELVEIAASDWNDAETSWSFFRHPLVAANDRESLSATCESHLALCRARLEKTRKLEAAVDRLAASAYELTVDEPVTEDDKHILLARPTAEACAQELISYAIGCMMGRYSLDEPGLIYARSGNEGFDPGRHATFPADDDGIIALTDTDWFDDDACHRLIEFLSVAWDKSHLEENLAFLAGNLSPRKNESSRETLRRYLSDNFFKDHLQTYKKRPIYWLFSSGKQRAFQALVYLHRYNEGTLARMRTEYVIPLQGMITSRIERLGEEIEKPNSTAQQKKLAKERDRLLKQRPELQEFDEKLRHYADMRIALDLDDGVKVNYGKFEDLLAEVKSVTGGDEE